MVQINIYNKASNTPRPHENRMQVMRMTRQANAESDESFCYDEELRAEDGTVMTCSQSILHSGDEEAMQDLMMMKEMNATIAAASSAPPRRSSAPRDGMETEAGERRRGVGGRNRPSLRSLMSPPPLQPLDTEFALPSPSPTSRPISSRARFRRSSPRLSADQDTLSSRSGGNGRSAIRRKTLGAAPRPTVAGRSSLAPVSPLDDGAIGGEVDGAGDGDGDGDDKNGGGGGRRGRRKRVSGLGGGTGWNGDPPESRRGAAPSSTASTPRASTDSLLRGRPTGTPAPLPYPLPPSRQHPEFSADPKIAQYASMFRAGARPGMIRAVMRIDGRDPSILEALLEDLDREKKTSGGRAPSAPLSSTSSMSTSSSILTSGDDPPHENRRRVASARGGVSSASRGGGERWREDILPRSPSPAAIAMASSLWLTNDVGSTDVAHPPLPGISAATRDTQPVPPSSMAVSVERGGLIYGGVGVDSVELGMATSLPSLSQKHTSDREVREKEKKEVVVGAISEARGRDWLSEVEYDMQPPSMTVVAEGASLIYGVDGVDNIEAGLAKFPSSSHEKDTPGGEDGEKKEKAVVGGGILEAEGRDWLSEVEFASTAALPLYGNGDGNSDKQRDDSPGDVNTFVVRTGSRSPLPLPRFTSRAADATVGGGGVRASLMRSDDDLEGKGLVGDAPLPLRSLLGTSGWMKRVLRDMDIDVLSGPSSDDDNGGESGDGIGRGGSARRPTPLPPPLLCAALPAASDAEGLSGVAQGVVAASGRDPEGPGVAGRRRPNRPSLQEGMSVRGDGERRGADCLSPHPPSPIASKVVTKRNDQNCPESSEEPFDGPSASEVLRARSAWMKKMLSDMAIMVPSSPFSENDNHDGHCDRVEEEESGIKSAPPLPLTLLPAMATVKRQSGDTQRDLSGSDIAGAQAAEIPSVLEGGKNLLLDCPTPRRFSVATVAAAASKRRSRLDRPEALADAPLPIEAVRDHAMANPPSTSSLAMAVVNAALERQTRLGAPGAERRTIDRTSSVSRSGAGLASAKGNLGGAGVPAMNITGEVELPLRSNPLFSKYFNMLKARVPRDWVKRVMEVDGRDPDVLDMDPNKPLKRPAADTDSEIGLDNTKDSEESCGTHVGKDRESYARRGENRDIDGTVSDSNEKRGKSKISPRSVTVSAPPLNSLLPPRFVSSAESHSHQPSSVTPFQKSPQELLHPCVPDPVGKTSANVLQPISSPLAAPEGITSFSASTIESTPHSDDIKGLKQSSEHIILTEGHDSDETRPGKAPSASFANSSASPQKLYPGEEAVSALFARRSAIQQPGAREEKEFALHASTSASTQKLDPGKEAVSALYARRLAIQIPGEGKEEASALHASSLAPTKKLDLGKKKLSDLFARRSAIQQSGEGEKEASALHVRPPVSTKELEPGKGKLSDIFARHSAIQKSGEGKEEVSALHARSSASTKELDPRKGKLSDLFARRSAIQKSGAGKEEVSALHARSPASIKELDPGKGKLSDIFVRRSSIQQSGEGKEKISAISTDRSARVQKPEVVTSGGVRAKENRDDSNADSDPPLRDDPEYMIYFKMLQMKVPTDAVKQAIIKDGKDPAIADLNPMLSLKRQNEASAPSDGGPALKDDPKYSKYFKMLRMKLPIGAVKQSLQRDGKDPNIVDLDPEKSLASQKVTTTTDKKPEKREQKSQGPKVVSKKIFWSPICEGKLSKDSLWAQAHDEGFCLDGLDYDKAEFASLFTTSKEAVSVKKLISDVKVKSKSQRLKVQLIDSRRQMNGSILLAKYKHNYDELARNLNQM